MLAFKLISSAINNNLVTTHFIIIAQIKGGAVMCSGLEHSPSLPVYSRPLPSGKIGERDVCVLPLIIVFRGHVIFSRICGMI